MSLLPLRPRALHDRHRQDPRTMTIKATLSAQLEKKEQLAPHAPRRERSSPHTSTRGRREQTSLVSAALITRLDSFRERRNAVQASCPTSHSLLSGTTRRVTHLTPDARGKRGRELDIARSPDREDCAQACSANSIENVRTRQKSGHASHKRTNDRQASHQAITKTRERHITVTQPDTRKSRRHTPEVNL